MRSLALVPLLTAALATPALALPAVPRSPMVCADRVARCVRADALYHFADLGIPRLTTESHGRRGDPINLLLLGSEQRLRHAFDAAGWAPADPMSLASAARMIGFMVDTRQHYERAPMSDLFLAGRRQDFCYQKNNIRNLTRDHLRIWRTPRFDAHGRPWWAVSATKDDGLELVEGVPMHHIAPEVDRERDYVVRELVGTGEVMRHYPVVALPGGGRGHNGDGDAYVTDGRIQVLELDPVAPTRVVSR